MPLQARQPDNRRSLWTPDRRKADRAGLVTLSAACSLAASRLATAVILAAATLSSSSQQRVRRHAVSLVVLEKGQEGQVLTGCCVLPDDLWLLQRRCLAAASTAADSTAAASATAFAHAARALVSTAATMPRDMR